MLDPSGMETGKLLVWSASFTAREVFTTRARLSATTLLLTYHAGSIPLAFYCKVDKTAVVIVVV